MAHFARVENGLVSQAIVINNSDCGGGDFPESEEAGQAFIESLGIDGEWKQTSYSASFRGNFAGIGYAFDGDNFIPPKPYPSWTLNGATWIPPVAMPEDGKRYIWDEETLSWNKIGQ